MYRKYIFEFESADEVVALDVYEDPDTVIYHSFRSKEKNQDAPLSAEKKYCNVGTEYTARLFYSKLYNHDNPIATVIGFDFSVCTEEELNAFLCRLICRFEESTIYRIGNIKEFVEFTSLLG